MCERVCVPVRLDLASKKFLETCPKIKENTSHRIKARYSNKYVNKNVQSLLFVRANRWTQPRCPLTGERIIEM